MKRKLDQSIGHVDTIERLLMEVAEIYADEHPEIVEQYKVTYAFAGQLKALLIALRTSY